MGPTILFYASGSSATNQSLGIASTARASTALPYSMYTTSQPFTAAGAQALGKRKRGQGRARQLLERMNSTRFELTVVVDCQAVSA